MRDNTGIACPPHVPELRLHLADEAHALWLKTEEELEDLGVPPPFWAFAWAGGQGLSRYVLDHPDVVRGCTVVDFASGSGIVAIAAAKAGATQVRAVDVDPFAGAAISLNSELNGVSVDALLSDVIGEALACDVLLAGNVFYDRPFSERLLPWFDALARRGVAVLVGDPGRAYLPKARVEAVARYEVPVTGVLEDAEGNSTTVWRWRPQ